MRQLGSQKRLNCWKSSPNLLGSKLGIIDYSIKSSRSNITLKFANILKIITFGIGVYLFNSSVAVALQQKKAGLGGVASNLMEPVGLFSNFVDSACFLIGGSFLIASVIKYMEHRRSPLMVPISTVVFLVIAGAVLVFLPFLYLFTG